MTLQIDQLRLTLLNAAGHEHRISLIATRAAELLAGRIEKRPALGNPAFGNHEKASASLNLNLDAADDEQAAIAIADACLEAITLRL